MRQLNEQQQAAIDANNNVVQLMAGAGTGKTTVIIEKIKDLILNQNILPYKILALTFTNNAATSLKNKLAEADIKNYQKINSFTFHSFSAYILKIYADGLEHYNKDFAIIDQNDQKRIMKNLFGKDENINELMYKISDVKGQAITHEDAKNHVSGFLDKYLKYQKYLLEHNYMDFDDLQLYLNELLDNDEYREKIQQRYDYILVDEYQDTSIVQNLIIKKLKKEDTKLFVVGDIDQSIYRWRGAKIENMLSMEENFEDVNTLKLEQNYRSTQKIIDCANSLIVNNEHRFDKSLFTDKPGGAKVTYKEFSSNLFEANYVVKEIQYHQQLHPNKTVAVLYRSNFQAKIIEDALINNNISYRLLGGMKFFDRAEVKDIISYLSLIFNHDDDLSFMRIINTPRRKIGDKTIEKIVQLSTNYGVSNFKACEMAGIAKSFTSLINKYHDLLLSDFDKYYDQLIKDLNYYEYLKSNSSNKDKYEEKVNNLTSLKEGIQEALKTYELPEYLQNILLFNGSDEINDKVILSTIHGAKGLEFDYVYMVGMNEGIMPTFRSLDGDIHDFEEERRICYVGVTRAKEKLTLTSYEEDYHRNYLPSSFLAEMNVEAKTDDFLI